MQTFRVSTCVAALSRTSLARLIAASAVGISCAGSSETQVIQVEQAVQHREYTTAAALYTHKGRDPRVLRALAENLLLDAAQSTDPAQRRAALIELSLAGRRADDLLERLTREAQSPLLLAEVLRLRLAHGDESAREPLRSLLSNRDPEVVDCAYAALKPDTDWLLLNDGLAAPRSQRRAVALKLVAAGPRTRLAELRELSRRDPEPSLRAAALAALTYYGAAASPVFEAALREHDPDERVRVTALEGLARVDPKLALPHLDQQLGAGVSSESIAAASALLRMQPRQPPERAWMTLQNALSTPDAALRAHAASVLAGLDLNAASVPHSVLEERLRVEPVHSVRLALALALGTRDSAAYATLVALSKSATLTGVEANAALADAFAPAEARLLALRGHPSAIVRATVARVLVGRGRGAGAVAELMGDGEWRVRLAAAGAALGGL